MNFWNILLVAAAAIFTFGIIIFIHEFGHFIVAKASKVKVNEFAMGMGPTLFKFKRKDTVYALRLFPIGGFCSMEGEDEDSDNEGSFGKAPVLNRILIVIAGAIMNLLLGFIVLSSLVAGQEAITSKTVSSFYENAATQQSGLQIGDTFYAINGRKLYVADDIVYEMMRAEDGIADVTVIRDGKKLVLEDFRFDTYEAEDGSAMIVLDFTVLPIETTFWNVIKESFRETGSVMRLIVVSIVDLITGRVGVNQLSGPVGIVTIIGQATSQGFRTLLNLLAFISINLGIFNLLPLPALDGGRLAFLLFEAVFKRRINPKYEAIVHVVGIVLLLALMLFVTYNDIARLFS